MPATLPTQQFVEIQEIKNGAVFLKKGGLRKLLMVGGVNFDLKSQAEQTLILGAFQNFLNTLDFPIQFFIHSRKVNIGPYLERINWRKEDESNELLKIQIEEYIDFIRAFVEENPIINKTFFAVVPYDPLPITTGVRGILSLFKKSSGTAAEQEKTKEEERLEQLHQRVDQVVAGLEQIGLRAQPLNDEELKELFYNLYNPQLIEKKRAEIAK